MVVTDIARTIIHTVGCSDVDIVNFREKVMSNEGKNGKYFFIDDLVEGRETFKAAKYNNCRPK